MHFRKKFPYIYPFALVFLCALPLGLILVANGFWAELYGVSTTAQWPSLNDKSSVWENFLQEKISTVGAKEAYREMGEVIAMAAPAKQHSIAHSFGTVIYDAEGYKALDVCDSRFLWGCYHEVVSKTLLTSGISFTTTLGLHCQDIPDQEGNCEHALGHGLLAWFGYREEDLSLALQACDRYVPGSSSSILAGCYSGVFMEFNLRSMTGLNEGGYRYTDPESIYALCYRLPERYRNTCASEAVQSWIVNTPHFDKAAFEKFGTWCRGFNTQELRDYCYSGIGNHLPMTDRPAKQVIEFCAAAAPTDSRAQVICRGTAAAVSRISTTGSGPFEICEGLVGASQHYCEAYASGEADFKKPQPMPSL